MHKHVGIHCGTHSNWNNKNKKMNKKNLYLFAGILTAIVFVSHLFDSEPKRIFGISASIWIVRLGWLAMSVSSFGNYFKLKKAENK